MNQPEGTYTFAVGLAQRLAVDLAETSAALWDARQDIEASDLVSARAQQGPESSTQSDIEQDYDRRVKDEDLRLATRSRFVTEHYADAVESGVKALNECVRHLSGCKEDGDALMTQVFSPRAPMLRLRDASRRPDDSLQRGHMMLCQGAVAAWRNPRAHSLIDDSPSRALMMLEAIDDLIRESKNAVRTRRRKSS